jgi:phosphoglycolate phosphatase-like HAD superfamily hydrolase
VSKKLIVWDLHGTLESGNERAVIRLSNEVLRRAGYEERFDDDDAVRLYGRKWHEYFRDLMPDAPRNVWMDLQEECFALSASDTEIQAQAMTPAPYAIEVLTAIAEQADQMVLSNTRPANLDIFLAWLGMLEYFPEGRRIGTDGHADGHVVTKVDALRDFLDGKQFEQILVVGDSGSDIELACEVGAVGVLYHHPHLPAKSVPADHATDDLRDVLSML